MDNNALETLNDLMARLSLLKLEWLRRIKRDRFRPDSAGDRLSAVTECIEDLSALMDDTPIDNADSPLYGNPDG